MNALLVITGSLCLSIALIEAWLLVMILINPETKLAKLISDSDDLLKSHLGYFSPINNRT